MHKGRRRFGAAVSVRRSEPRWMPVRPELPAGYFAAAAMRPPARRPARTDNGHRINAGGREVTLARRPAREIGEIRVERPVARHVEGGRVEGFERERQIAVAVLDVLASGRPVRSEHVVVEHRHGGIDRR